MLNPSFLNKKETALKSNVSMRTIERTLKNAISNRDSKLLSKCKLVAKDGSEFSAEKLTESKLATLKEKHPSLRWLFHTDFAKLLSSKKTPVQASIGKEKSDSDQTSGRLGFIPQDLNSVSRRELEVMVRALESQNSELRGFKDIFKMELDKLHERNKADHDLHQGMNALLGKLTDITKSRDELSAANQNAKPVSSPPILDVALEPATFTAEKSSDRPNVDNNPRRKATSSPWFPTFSKLFSRSS